MPYSLVHLEPLKEDNLFIKDKTAEFILSPMCPLFGGYHYAIPSHNAPGCLYCKDSMDLQNLNNISLRSELNGSPNDSECSKYYYSLHTGSYDL